MAKTTLDDFRSLLSQVEQELEQRTSQAACPHCGRAIEIVSGERRGPGRKPGRTATAKKGGRSMSRRGPRRSSELVSLALKYARAKHNGRIGDAYRDVKNGIARQAKGKSPKEVKALKADWFRQHMA
jgi:hypothetical protein